MNIDGIGAIVFGGAHGVGSQIARHLADMGADVSIFDIDGAAAADVAAEFGGYSQHCDFRDETVVAACDICDVALWSSGADHCECGDFGNPGTLN